MSNNEVERAWEERVVFPERGSRITHYILHDTAGGSILAAVGTERTARHTIYSVSADFLRMFGSTSRVNAETIWKTRRELVKWLVSLVANKGPIFANSSQRIIETTPSLEYLKSSMARLSNSKSPGAMEGSENPAVESSDIIWSGDSWLCHKQLKHYPAFSRSGIKIHAYSFVYVMGEGREYLAYVQDLYENQQCEKMVRVRWFNFHKDIEDLLSNIETHAREVFITPYEQDISAECIDGLAAILRPNHFKKCLKFLPIALSYENFVCHRQVRNRKIKPFCLSQLHGYSTQPVLALLISHIRTSTEVEGSDPRSPFKVNDDVEVLSQDSGIRGCWFRCKILHLSKNLLKVQYHDVLDVDGPNKLEEWVPSCNVADPDKLAMRHAGRLTVRPWPTDIESDSTTFDVGAAVDAWWSDGWWEGVVIGYKSSHNDLQVFFPGENKFLTIERKNMRVSKDWIDGNWINIKPNSDILSSITSILNPMPQLPPRPVLAGTSTSASVNNNVHSTPTLQWPKDSLPSSSKASEQKVAQQLNHKKRLVIRDLEDQAARNSDNAGPELGGP